MSPGIGFRKGSGSSVGVVALDPLQIAKEAAAERKPILGGDAVVNLRVGRGHGREQNVLYLREPTRDRLSRLAYTMAVSFTDAVGRLSTLDYEASPELSQSGRDLGEQTARTVRVRAKMSPEVQRRYEEIASEVGVTGYHKVKSPAVAALDAILSGQVLPVGYSSIDEATEERLRRDPLEPIPATLEVDGKNLHGKIVIRISTIASRGLITIIKAFDKRRQNSRLRGTITTLADLPVEYELVSDILDLQRLHREVVLPMWVIDKFSRIALDMMLIPKPAHRRPSTLISIALEYIGQGAIQLIHNRRSVTSIDALREDAERRREERRARAPKGKARG